MSRDFILHRDGWLEALSSDVETRSISRLQISVCGENITRNISKRSGGEREAINVGLLPLAQFVTENWWTLLYEPLRPKITDAFRARHCLEAGMGGYPFPSLALWSGGEKTLVADWASVANRFANISFIAPAPRSPLDLERPEVETVLMDFIETVLERVGGSARDLRDAWARVQHSMANDDEFAFCSVSGRLGVDPYDPTSPDFSEWAEGIPEMLFSDISEITEIEGLPETSRWLKESQTNFTQAPKIDISQFGDPAVDSLSDPAWVTGVYSAQLLRAHTHVSVENPRLAVQQLLDRLIAESGTLSHSGPNGINALIRREGDDATIGIIARSARQRRFRACAAAYLAWTEEQSEARAATEAITRRQQASRAFAAEMLAPRETLLMRAPRSGFDNDDIHDLASEFICPFDTVIWQAQRAGIALRGIELPANQRASVLAS